MIKFIEISVLTHELQTADLQLLRSVESHIDYQLYSSWTNIMLYLMLSMVFAQPSH